MYALNLPNYDVKIRKTDNGIEIFDALRKKFLILTPEEWVRQNFTNYLIVEKRYPASLMANEATIKLNSLTRRCDTIVYNNMLEPVAICEYKNPEIVINQDTFDQIVSYNIVLKVKYLIVSNGITHYCCKIDYTKMDYEFLKDIPFYDELISP